METQQRFEKQEIKEKKKKQKHCMVQQEYEGLTSVEEELDVSRGP